MKKPLTRPSADGHPLPNAEGSSIKPLPSPLAGEGGPQPAPSPARQPTGLGEGAFFKAVRHTALRHVEPMNPPLAPLGGGCPDLSGRVRGFFKALFPGQPILGGVP
jgi:hypothetical protein